MITTGSIPRATAADGFPFLSASMRAQLPQTPPGYGVRCPRTTLDFPFDSLAAFLIGEGARPAHHPSAAPPPTPRFQPRILRPPITLSVSATLKIRLYKRTFSLQRNGHALISNNLHAETLRKPTPSPLRNKRISPDPNSPLPKSPPPASREKGALKVFALVRACDTFRAPLERLRLS